MTQTEHNSLPSDNYALPKTSSSLCKMKETLMASLNQVHSSAKATLTAKGIGLAEKDVGDLFRKKIDITSPSKNSEVSWLVDGHLAEDKSAVIGLMEKTDCSLESHSSPQHRPHDRMASCRVCVRSLSSGNDVVSHRLCSECCYKVCEDCASYSEQENESEQNYWKCSICRRKSASPRQTSAETLALSSGNTSRRGTFAGDSSDSQFLSQELYDGSARQPAEKEKQPIIKNVAEQKRSSYEKFLPPSPEYINESITCQTNMKVSDESWDNSASSLLSTGMFSEHRRQSFRSSRSRNLAEDVDAVDQDGARESSPALQVNRNENYPHYEERARQYRSCSSPCNTDINDFGLSLSPGNRNEPFSARQRAAVQSRSRSASAKEEFNAGSLDAEPIRIVVDHVDHSYRENELEDGNATPSVITSVRLHRDTSCSKDFLFTESFGLSLADGDKAHITYVKPSGSACLAGLKCGDVVLSWDGVKLAGGSIRDFHEDLKHSGDSIEVIVLKRSPWPSHQSENHESTIINHSPQRPKRLETKFLCDSNQFDKSPLPSPTRRRLPRAPLIHSTTEMSASQYCSNNVWRVLLKVMIMSEEMCKQLHVTITVLKVEKSNPSNSYNTDEEKSLNWFQFRLLLSEGTVKEFSTEPARFTESMAYMSTWVWTSLSESDLAYSVLGVSVWKTSTQAESIKVGDSFFNWPSMQTDGRPFWICIDPFSISADSGLHRRLSKSSSHDPSFPYIRNCEEDQTISAACESIKTDLPESFDKSTHSLLASIIPRSRSAETNTLKLDLPNTPEFGLSAPASLAPSRRNSSLMVEDDKKKLSANPRCNSLSTNDLYVREDIRKTLSASYEDLAVIGSDYKCGTYSPTHPTQLIHTHPTLEKQKSDCTDLPSSVAESGRKLPNPYHYQISYMDKFKAQLKLGIVTYHDQVDVEVIAARHLPSNVEDCEVEPDTFVQVYLCDQNGILASQKTKTMRQTSNPKFHQTLSFKFPNRFGLLLKMNVNLEDPKKYYSTNRQPSGSQTLSSKKMHVQCIGKLTISLDNLPLGSLNISWYRLTP